MGPVVLHRFQFNKNVNFAILVLVSHLSHFKALKKKQKTMQQTALCCPNVNDLPETDYLMTLGSRSRVFTPGSDCFQSVGHALQRQHLLEEQ